MRRTAILASLTLALGVSACGRPTYKPVVTGTVDGTKVTLSSPDGDLTEGENRLHLIFHDANNVPRDVQAPAVIFQGQVKDTQTHELIHEDARVGRRGVGNYEVQANLRPNGPWTGIVRWTDHGTPHQWAFKARAD